MERRPTEASMAVRSTANFSRDQLTRGCPYLTCRLPRTLVVWQTAPRLTNASCYSRYQGIPTPLSTSGHREYQLFPYYAAVDHFIKDRPRRYQHSLYRTSLPRKIPTLPLTQQRDWHLFSVSPTACAEPIAYSALDWHCTQRNPSPVDYSKRLSMIAQL